MKATEILLDLTKLNHKEREELVNWLNENSDFNDWHIKLLQPKKQRYLYTDSINEFRLSGELLVKKKLVSYEQFRAIVSENFR